MKKAISVLLIVLLAVPSLAFTAFQASPEESFAEQLETEESIKELRALFRKAKYEGRSYAFYSPVKDENDTAKYPLIIYLHGFGHEFTYLSASFMPYWASEELQSKFEAGGAHIILPQVFHIAAKWEKLQALIENYIAENSENVDTDCVVIMGASLGGAKAFKLFTKTPGFYSAAVISCPARTPTEEELSAVSTSPVWLISSKNDFITGKHLKSWDRILGSTAVPELCNWMFFDGAVHGPNGKRKLGHSLSKIISYDGVMFDRESFADIYDDVSTVNGLGENVEITWEHGIIDWITRCSALRKGQ